MAVAKKTKIVAKSKAKVKSPVKAPPKPKAKVKAKATKPAPAKRPLPAKKPVKPVVPPAAAPAAKQAHPVSPLTPKVIKDLPPMAGVRLGAVEAGVRYAGRTDLLCAVFSPHTQVAGVFTTSKTRSAPVDWCRGNLARAGEGSGEARLLIVNSGNANAFTGAGGIDAVRKTAEAGAVAVGCEAEDVFIASTGVIGEPLPWGKIVAKLDEAIENASAGGWLAAAKAIMTTDTFPKLASATAKIGEATVRINGIAKGSGMIAPDMATMLAYVVTDATLPHDVLQELLSEGVQASFNAITVDSDTSTSDTLMLFATGRGARHEAVGKASDKRLADFRAKLNQVLLDLALLVVRDGEGASKQIAIEVTGAESDAAAKTIALSIANSPLVKTAIAGEDANWGRVVMAVGKSGEAADRDKLAISFGPFRVAHQGLRDPAYSEAKVSAYMKRDEIDMSVDIGLGKGRAKVWTCDLTDGYIRINGAYRS
ncbi:Arginine biosynthesis bifunctional protein ArgJ, chloroplastic [Alphaproteobacteria bacterium SO-S41]|nr:Arginine biosynthesis bifunctional protein ArgJ, chloroplastic [Alphaproteobacteria bacterium SO-S41]